MRRRAVLASLALLLAACASAAPGPDILGRWTLASIDGATVENGGWLDFSADGAMRAAIGCNNFTTRYDLAGARLTFIADASAIVATARCNEDEAGQGAARDFPWDAPRLIARPSNDELDLTSGTRTFRYVRALP